MDDADEMDETSEGVRREEARREEKKMRKDI